MYNKMRREPIRNLCFFSSRYTQFFFLQVAFFLTMQQTFLNIFKKDFNVFKALIDFLFCLVAYIWPKSRKDDAVLAVTKRSR